MDASSPMQKRVAAYLVLMKEPRPTELVPLLRVLFRETDPQFRSFVESHLINIVSTTEPETEAYVTISTYTHAFVFRSVISCSFFLVPRLRFKIRDILQGNEIGPIMDPTKFSRNYKMGSVEGNMIFEGNSYLPKELMLETTLKAFGYNIDLLEVNLFSCSILHWTPRCVCSGRCGD